MKYHIYSAHRWRAADELITEYPCLKNYDFGVEEISKPFDYRIIRVGYITIDTLEQLGELRKDVESPLIVTMVIMVQRS